MYGNMEKEMLNYKINEYIKQYYNKLLYKHLKIITTIKILQRNCYFFRTKHQIMEYIMKCI